MTITYDPSTPSGLCRLLIPDTDLTYPIFQDAEITAFMGIEFNVIKRAAALALEVIAANRAMVLQVISTNGLSTNGATLAAAIINRAKALREQAHIEEGYVEGGSFDYAEQVTGQFAYRERMWDEIMRSEGGTTP
jgi:hypothetical protein